MNHKLVVIGGGGHARVVLDILHSIGQFEIAGFTSEAPEERTSQIFACQRLGTDEVLPDLLGLGVRHAFVAIGDNPRRRLCFNRLAGMGFSLVNAVSPYAIVSPHVSFGTGIAVMPGATINAGTSVADGVIVNTNASIDHDCVIGAFAHVAPGVAIAGNVNVGSGVLLGIGARVIPGISIGPNTIIGAGAAVIEDVASDRTAVGVPAMVKSRLGAVKAR